MILLHEPAGFAPVEPTPPPLDRGTPTHVYEAMSWLTESPYHLQWGLNPAVLDPDRASLIRGRVFDRDGEPLEGIEVSVLDRPELGRTRTRLDAMGALPTGTYELLVNGGGPMVLEFRHSGYLLAQRTVDVPWNDWISAPDVVMTQRSLLECGSMGGGGGFLFGAAESDPDDRGTRWMGVYIPAGTGVDTNRDGMAEHSSFDVCMVENTTGTEAGAACTYDSDCNGTGLCQSGYCRLEREAGMPGELPATTTYTFAAEYEVRASGSAVPHGYQFVGNGSDGTPSTADDGLVYAYVRGDELASFGAGALVPVGTYDATRGAWIPGNDGVVIHVSRSSGCVVTPTLPSAEASAICAQTARFPHGQRFWRAPVRHFSPCDLNFLAGLLDDMPTSDTDTGEGDPDSASRVCGSIIDCETQGLGERVPLTGTGLDLSYVSTHQQGLRDAFRVAVTPITEPTLPVDPARVRVELLVAGRRLPAIGSPFTPAQARSEQEVVWDGLDAYGRRMLGPQLAYLRIGYEYEIGYARPAGTSSRSFGRAYAVSGEISDTGSATIWITSRALVGVLDDRVSGLGGWRLEGHHAYDPATGTMFYSDGQQRSASSVSAVTNTRTTVGSGSIQGVAAGPDGTIYFYWNGRVRRLPRGASTYEDFGPSGVISSGRALAVSRDGLVYVADPSRDCVHRIAIADESYDVLLGICDSPGSTAGPGPDAPVLGPSATRLSNPNGVAVAPDGSVLIAESGNNRVIRHIAGPLDTIGAGRDRSESLVELIAGATSGCSDASRGVCAPAPAASSVAVGPDGSIYFTRNGGSGFTASIMRVMPDGRVRLHTGGGSASADPADGALAACASTSDTACAAMAAYPNVYSITVDREGDLCFEQAAIGTFDRRVRCVREGRVQSMAGLSWPGSTSLTCPDAQGLCWASSAAGYPSTRTDINAEGSITWSPDGRLFYADGARLRVVEPRLDGSLVSSHLIASEDGGVLYEFTAGGRHLRTLNALTQVPVIEFNYQSDGRLSGFWDVERAYTSIAYSSSPARITIQAPGSLTTTLALSSIGGYPASDGYVTEIENPAGDLWGDSPNTFTYDSSLVGLLTRFSDTRNRAHNFFYDSTTGRLETDQDAPDNPPSTIPEQELTHDAVIDVGTGRVDHERVVRTSAAGHDTTYRFAYRANPTRRRIETATGAYVDVTTRPDGRESTTTVWDGSSRTVTTAPDAFLGGGASYPTRMVLHRPLEGDSVVTASRSYTSGALPRTDSMTNGGRTFAQKISTSGSGWEVLSNSESSFVDRRTTTTLDSQGRVSRVAIPGQHPICITYTSSTSRRPSQILQAPISGSTCNPSASERRRTDLGYHSTQRWLTSITRDSEVTTLVPDGRGWVQSATLPGRSDTLVIERNGQGTVTWIETPGHGSTQRHAFTYTGRDLPRTYTPPAVSGASGAEITNTTYTLDGQLDQLTFRDGRVIDLGYDSNGSLWTIGGTGSGVDHTYDLELDPGGRLAWGEGGGVRLDRVYDGPVLALEQWSDVFDGEVEHWVSPQWTGTVLATERAQIGAVSQTVSYGYDDDLWIASASISPSLPAVSLYYNAPVGTSRTTYVDVGSAIMDVIQNGFGETNRLIAQHTATVLDRQVCTRDLQGRITRVLESVGVPGGGLQTRTELYGYDGAGRLNSWRRTTSCTTCAATCTGTSTTYSYNDAGNRTDLTFNAEDQHTNGGRTYNTIGQMSARSYGGLGTGTLQHDRFGRLRTFAISGITFYLSYDVVGRLVYIDSSHGFRESFVYRDGLNPIAWYRHWYNGSTWIDDYAFFGYASQSHTPDVMWRDRGGDGIDGTYRIVPDERGSVRAVVDVSTGAIVQRIDYDPWGVPTFSGTAPEYDRFQPFGFAGGIYMPSQMWHFGARDYDPAIGRWTTKDPILFAGGLNLYEYAGSDPVNYVDRTGTIPALIAVPLILGVGGAAWAAAHQWTREGRVTGRTVVTGFAAGAAGGLVAAGVGALIPASGLALAGSVGAADALFAGVQLRPDPAV